MDENNTNIFISHANPEDNYFAGWLATKLRLLGYRVWCDVSSLSLGADSWKVIDDAIRNRSVKFIFVVSSSSLKKDGTMKELAVADKVKKTNFVIPIRLEKISHSDLPPEIIRLNSTDFYNNWAEGFNRLVLDLTRAAIPTTNNLALAQMLPYWRDASGVMASSALDKDEPYLTNWFSMTLPEMIYIHVPSRFSLIETSLLRFPAVLDQGLLISFADKNSLENITISETEAVYTSDFLKEVHYQLSDESWTISGTNQKVVQLLNGAFLRFLQITGLSEYSYTGNRRSYYFDEAFPLKKIPGAKRGVSLTGVRKEYEWHFGLEGSASLFPEPTVAITYHVIFTQSGVPIQISRKQHSLRRSFGKDWYNRQWRDHLLTAMNSLAGNNQDIEIPVGNSQLLRIATVPISLASPKGYLEPQNNDITNE